MTRAPSPFRQADVTKAIKGTVAAGVDIARIEIDAVGKIVIVPGKPTGLPAAPADELDRELADWEARHGEG
jgi:hypothetical protein